MRGPQFKNMIVYFNVVKINEVVIDEASQVSFILESLPKSCLQFLSNTVMSKLDNNLTILLNESYKLTSP